LGTNQLFTTFNGSHTRCEAIFPGNEASISIFQIIFPSFSAKYASLLDSCLLGMERKNFLVGSVVMALPEQLAF
jgi:hypothetical protein